MLELLFKPGETIGLKRTVYKLDTQVMPAAPDKTHEFFIINPLKSGSTSAMLENVAAFRNILIELDGPSLERQEELIERRLKLPFTTKVYSGGKSYHYVISLAADLPDLATYQRIVDCIYAVVNHMDPACRNANRLSRLGGSVRADTGRTQEIKELRNKCTHEELHQWLFVENGSLVQRSLMPRVHEDPVRVEMGQVREPSGATYRLISEGDIGKRSRHEALMLAAIDLRRCGFEEEDLRVNLEQAAELIGVGGRGDVDGIIRWVLKNIEAE